VLEIEMKFRAEDWSAIETQLIAWNAVAVPARLEVDHYFNAPDRDFAQTDEAVRLRRIGTGNTLTYKGPKIDVQTKARPEIEVTLAQGEKAAADAVRFLTSLGMKPVLEISKLRRVFQFSRGGFAVEACLDDAGAVGKFVELEIMAEEADFETAKSTLLRTAAELGLTDQERRSYLKLHLDRAL
jgi:adenylate cyclase class 2